jgi:small-conductance mechanosensitive channel
VATFVFVCCLALAGNVLAQLPESKAPSEHRTPSPAEPNLAGTAGGLASPDPALEARLTEARAQLAAIEKAGPADAPAGVSRQELSRRRGLGDRLVRLYEQQMSNAAELAHTRRRKDALAQEAQAWNRFAEPPPYSILRVDHLREELQAARLRIKAGETSTSLLDTLIEEDRVDLAAAEETIRRLNERLEEAADAALEAILTWQRDLERLRSQVAAATLATLESERRLRQEEMAESRILVGLLQRQLVFAEAGATFTQADLDQITGRIDRERQELNRDLAAALAQREKVLQALDTARQESALARERPDSPEAAAHAEALHAAREAQLETDDITIRGLRLMLEGTNVERILWELRFAGYDSRSLSTLAEAERRLRGFARRLSLWRDQVRQQLEVTSSQIQMQAARAQELSPDSALHSLARDGLDNLRERDRSLLRVIRTIDRLDRLAQRIEDNLRSAEARLPLTERLQRLRSGVRSFVHQVWDFELFTAEDTITVDGQKITGKRSVTIGKIVMAVFILVAGIWIIDLLTRLVEPVIVKRLKIEANQARLIRRWLRTLMVGCLVVFSLVSVKIPLTVFAFAGGALAIGLGFGMQTILKNLVSGLILLFERPFRVGDVLDVGGQKGTVTSIGLRASVLHLWDGTETLIPNSSLLENNVTNWTYSNRKVRFAVSVGVAYGSDARRVIQLLNEAAERHGLVEQEPKPQVLFTEFGDSTLAFELRFWLDVGKSNAAQVSSDLRLMIAGSFAENGIVIAFPQRDLHLHGAAPIQVQIVPGGEVPRDATTTP